MTTTASKEHCTQASVSLQGLDQVHRFFERALQVPERLDLESEGIQVNAKSMMGIFSLDLQKPITLSVYAEKERAQEILELLEQATQPEVA